MYSDFFRWNRKCLRSNKYRTIQLKISKYKKNWFFYVDFCFSKLTTFQLKFIRKQSTYVVPFSYRFLVAIKNWTTWMTGFIMLHNRQSFLALLFLRRFCFALLSMMIVAHANNNQPNDRIINHIVGCQRHNRLDIVLLIQCWYFDLQNYLVSSDKTFAIICEVVAGLSNA